MSINFPRTEEEVLKWWQSIDAFQTQLRLSEGRPRFTFYDGPPFATGLPHYGHLLASTIKDIVPRYWSMQGRHVVRRFGWDTHGLPIEYEIDKKLGMSGRDAVQKIGIEKYNAECRAIVMTYASEWRQTIDRLGRWIDFDNDYKTMDMSFMESVWWVFKQLYDKDQVYRAYQIMPYSTALNTPVSNFEANQNVQDRQDPAIWVTFPLKSDPNTHLVAYTTTPWTLPSNICICAHPDFRYAKVADEATGRTYICHEALIHTIYKNPKTAKYKVTGHVTGKEMLGWKYEPLFPYFAQEFEDAFCVINATFVKADEGTGLVHTSPAFGPDDFTAATAAGIISYKRLPPCPVDDKGCYTEQVPDYAGQHVKDADKAILKHLRTTGRMIVESQVMHAVKYCWRSDTPLIFKAVFSWFVKIENAIPGMLKNIDETNWVPSFVKEKRFANWIKDARDWNISRNRYWGTPIPLWVSEDYEEIVVIGSIDELEEMSGVKVHDLHRDTIDNITIPSKKGKGTLKRVDEVFDCWFESGSMPYASSHYPFENKEDFLKSRFPADFIAEGLDQTRGWFYTLTVLGAKLYDISPYKNVIVNGMILAENGKKMSKRLKNYPEPTKIMDSYGSDALRLYMINSPVVRAEPLRFKEAGVKEIVAKVLLPLWNSYRFFDEQVALLKKESGVDFMFQKQTETQADLNVMDRWILADCQSLLSFMHKEMEEYRLYTVVPRLLQLIDNLTNWYIRFNRKRLKGLAGSGAKDTQQALNTLCDVLFILVRALAPFMPFLTEHIYKLLAPRIPEDQRQGTGGDSRSVHFLSFPEVRKELFDPEIERKVLRMQKVIDMGRTSREKCDISLKTPLKTLVILADPSYLEDVRTLATYIREELNVRDLTLTSEEAAYNVKLRALVDWPVLGKKLKKEAQQVRKALPNLTNEQLQAFIRDKKITVAGHELDDQDLTVIKEVAPQAQSNGSVANGTSTGPKWEPASEGDVIVLLDTQSYAELADEGFVRDLINRVQRMRKKAGLVPTDDVRHEYQVLTSTDDVDPASMINSQQALISSAIRAELYQTEKEKSGKENVILEEEHELRDTTLSLRLLKI